ncbi:hypothetical protein ACFLQK_02700 [bacterium]
MKKCNLGIAFGVILATVVMFVSAGSSAEPLKIGDRAPEFDIKDIMGRIIRADDLEDWIIVYGFGDEGSAEHALGMLKDLTRAEPDPKGVLFVCVADTSKHNSKILRPFVKKLLKKEYKKEIKNVEAILQEKGVETSTRLENRYILVADMKADIFQLFGISDTKNIAQGFLVDGNGIIRGHYMEYSDKMAEDLRLAMTTREADRQYALKSGRKKKSKWKYYVLGGAVLWLTLK